MQSPVTDPQLMVTAHAGTQITALTIPVVLDNLTTERGPHMFWTAPDGLRGGLNPMLWQHGARLVALDGVVIDAATANDWAFRHDGEAAHSGIPARFRSREAVFCLAEPAPIAGLAVHLRSTEDRRKWPGTLGLELSDDGQVWRSALTVDLTASDLPQVFALPTPIPAELARIATHGCRTDPNCPDIALPEIGLVASPEWRLSQPVDLADPALGGHVVMAMAVGRTETDEAPFGWNWNSALLTENSPSDALERRDDFGDRIQSVIGFHTTRAARIAAVEWQGHADDAPRIDGA